MTVLTHVAGVCTRSGDPDDQADQKRCVGDAQDDYTGLDFVLWLFVRHGLSPVGECGSTIDRQGLRGPYTGLTVHVHMRQAAKIEESGIRTGGPVDRLKKPIILAGKVQLQRFSIVATKIGELVVSTRC